MTPVRAALMLHFKFVAPLWHFINIFMASDAVGVTSWWLFYVKHGPNILAPPTNEPGHLFYWVGGYLDLVHVLHVLLLLYFFSLVI